MLEPLYDQSQTVGRDEMPLSFVEVTFVTIFAYDLTWFELPDHDQLVDHFTVFPLRPLIWEHCEPVPSFSFHRSWYRV